MTSSPVPADGGAAERCRKCGFPLVTCAACGERPAGCGEALCDECYGPADGGAATGGLVARWVAAPECDSNQHRGRRGSWSTGPEGHRHWRVGPLVDGETELGIDEDAPNGGAATGGLGDLAERTETYVRMILLGTGAMTLDQVNRHAPDLARGVAAPYLALLAQARAEGAAELRSRYERQYDHADLPRWDEDPVVTAQGWAAGRCGNCGEVLPGATP